MSLRTPFRVVPRQRGAGRGRSGSGRRARVAAVGAAAAMLAGSALVAPAPPARAGVYVPWSQLLPGWTEEYIPSSENVCVSGRPDCVRATLKELAWVLEQTGRRCHHHAVFSMAYLRMTQSFRWSTYQPGYYEDVRFATHQSAVFARYYTDAYTNWRSGRRGKVPQAWLLAFDAARDKRLTASGDLLMAMNAHINRDLAFVVAGVGLVAPDGSSRKRDFDKVEHFLNLAMVPMLVEGAARWDPTLDDASDPVGLLPAVLFQLISGWRETAWRNAEALVSAPNEAARARVARRIEAAAATNARLLMTSTAYLAPLTGPQARDGFCAANHATRSPEPYVFGTPRPYGA